MEENGERVEGTPDDLDRVARHVAPRIGAPPDDEVTWAYRPTGSLAGGSAWASGEGEYELVVAEFATPELARSSYQGFVDQESSWGVAIVGAAIVTRGVDGILTIHMVSSHEQSRGVVWGSVVGVTIGVLFPPTIIAAALVGGTSGLAIGHLRHTHHREDVAEELGAAIAPGMTGVVVLAVDPKALSRARRDASSSTDEMVVSAAELMANASRVTSVPVNADAVADFSAAASE